MRAGLGAALLGVAAAVQALSGPAITGIVTDKNTGQPVVGAQIVVVWDGTNISGYFSNDGGCHYVQNAVTDSMGRFSLPAWDKIVPNHILYDYRIGVYHAGYGVVEGQYIGGIAGQRGQAAPGGNKLLLPPFNGTVKQRLEGLQRIRTYARCAEAGMSRRNFLDFYRAMNDEIKQILATPAGKLLEAAEREQRTKRNLALGTPIDPPLARSLDAVIESLQNARDGELYEPVRRP